MRYSHQNFFTFKDKQLTILLNETEWPATKVGHHWQTFYFFTEQCATAILINLTANTAPRWTLIKCRDIFSIPCCSWNSVRNEMQTGVQDCCGMLWLKLYWFNSPWLTNGLLVTTQRQYSPILFKQYLNNCEKWILFFFCYCLSYYHYYR